MSFEREQRITDLIRMGKDYSHSPVGHKHIAFELDDTSCVVDRNKQEITNEDCWAVHYLGYQLLVTLEEEVWTLSCEGFGDESVPICPEGVSPALLLHMLKNAITYFVDAKLCQSALKGIQADAKTAAFYDAAKKARLAVGPIEMRMLLEGRFTPEVCPRLHEYGVTAECIELDKFQEAMAAIIVRDKEIENAEN